MNELAKIIIDRLEVDVCEYLKIPLSQYKDFCLHSTDMLAEQWNKRNPKTESEIVEFYQENWDWYIGDLAWWHTQVEGRKMWFTHNFEILQALGARNVLDYGCGIGSDGLTLAASGCHVLLIDFETPALKFARWRAKKYGIHAEFLHPNELGFRVFDCIMLIDVLEHIFNYIKILTDLSKRCWLMCISAPFKDHKAVDAFHPQHFYDDSSHGLHQSMDTLGYAELEGNFWIRKQFRWDAKIILEKRLINEKSG